MQPVESFLFQGFVVRDFGDPRIKIRIVEGLSTIFANFASWQPLQSF